VSRLRVLFCRHRWAIHLCQPPHGSPSLIICDHCGLVHSIHAALAALAAHKEATK